MQRSSSFIVLVEINKPPISVSICYMLWILQQRILLALFLILFMCKVDSLRAGTPDQEAAICSRSMNALISGDAVLAEKNDESELDPTLKDSKTSHRIAMLLNGLIDRIRLQGGGLPNYAGPYQEVSVNSQEAPLLIGELRFTNGLHAFIGCLRYKTADSVWTTIIRLDGEQSKLISDIVESTKSE